MAHVDHRFLRSAYGLLRGFTLRHNRGPTTSECKRYLGWKRETLRAIAQAGYIVSRQKTLANGQIINEWRPAMFKPKAVLLWYLVLFGRWFRRLGRRLKSWVSIGGRADTSGG